MRMSCFENGQSVNLSKVNIQLAVITNNSRIKHLFLSVIEFTNRKYINMLNKHKYYQNYVLM